MLRKIAQLGHPVLRQRAREVTSEELRSSALQTLIDDLIETMHDANGAGLAAPQIHESVRVVAVHVRDNPRYPYKPNIPLTVLVNPVITSLTEERFENYEGCLSVPNLRGVVLRSTHVRVQAWDRHGKNLDFEVRGLSAGTYQHEVDHLDGVLFVDRVTDPRTLTCWAEFDRFHKSSFIPRAEGLVTRYGQ